MREKPRERLQQSQFDNFSKQDTFSVHLRLVTTELPMTVHKTLKMDWELDVTTANNILNLEFRNLGVNAKLLDNACVQYLSNARRESSSLLWREF